MASVRITQSLQSIIEERIYSKFNKLYENQRKPLSDTFGDRVYAYIFRKDLQHMNALPENYMNASKSFYVKIKDHQNNSIEREIELTQERRVPVKGGSYYSPFEMTHQAFYDELFEYVHSAKEIIDERDMVLDAYKNVVNNCTTLKKLLKMMPEIEMFIPKEVMQKHYKKETPRPRKQNIVEPEKTDENVRQALAKLKFNDSIGF